MNQPLRQLFEGKALRQRTCLRKTDSGAYHIQILHGVEFALNDPDPEIRKVLDALLKDPARAAVPWPAEPSSEA